MKAKKIIKALRELGRLCEVQKGCAFCPFLKTNNAGFDEHCILVVPYSEDWKLLKREIRRLF